MGLGLAKDQSLETLKKWREAETQHGRVAMLAFIGLLITEEPIAFHPLFEVNEKDIGPAIRHLDEVRATTPIFFEISALFIGALEVNRALIGWKSPDEAKFQELNDEYYPGDVNFDPLGLKPDDAAEVFEMSTKEIYVNLGLTADKFDPSSVPLQFGSVV